MSACFFTQTIYVGLNVTVAVLIAVEGERQSIKTSAIFHSWVFLHCLLFRQVMLGYLHDKALFKVFLDGTGSILFVQ